MDAQVERLRDPHPVPWLLVFPILDLKRGIERRDRLQIRFRRAHLELTCRYPGGSA